jgi:Ricin-type beta-trefoil lectin domain-like/Secretion system C-terminal sorting domain
MKSKITNLLLLLSFIGLSISKGHSQCANFPKPEFTSVDDNAGKQIITITNLPAGASSSIDNTFTLGKTVYSKVEQRSNYNVRMRLNGCESQTPLSVFEKSGYPKYFDGCYRFVNKATGKVLEVEGNSQAYNARIRQATFTGTDNQLWQNVYRNYTNNSFRSRSSSLWLDVVSCDEGASAKQGSYDNTVSAIWQMYGQGDGTFVITGSCGKALKADSSSDKVIISTFTNSDYFKWSFIKTTCPFYTCSETVLAGENSVCVGSTNNFKVSGIVTPSATVKWNIQGGGLNSPNASISANGDVTALNTGTADIYAIVYDGTCIATPTKSITIAICPPASFDPTKCYRIVNEGTNKALDVKAESLADGAQIQQFQYSSGANQLWQIVKSNDGTYNIISKSSGKLIDAPDCAENAIIQQFTADGTTSQKWRLTKQVNGSFKIYNQTCDRPIRGRSHSDNIVEITTDFAASNYNWVITEAPCPSTTVSSFDPTKCYSLTARHSNKIMETASNSTANGITVQQGTWASLPRQVWRIKSVDGTFYNLVNGFSGSLVDVKGVSSADGAIIQQYGNNGGDNQKWRFDKNTEGYNIITAKHSGKALDVKGASTADGARVQQYTKHGETNQQWTVSEVGCPTGTVALQSAQIYTADGYREAHKGIITWVSNAADADYFTVDKLDKNGSFETLDKINAKPISALSDKNYYIFTDNQPFEGENTYRIGLVTDNAPPQYSNVISLNFNKTMDFTVYPNPTSDYIDVDLKPYENRPVVLSLIDATGHEIKSISLEKAAKTQRIELEGFTNGLYLVRIHTAGKRNVTRLFNRIN